MRILQWVVGLAAVVLLGAAIVGLVTRDDPADAPATGPGEVAISGFAFGPEALQVAVGSTVTWTNEDNAAHTVDGGELDSDSIGKGQTFEHTFETAGTFDYVCAFHPFMKGSVEVSG